MTHPDQPAPRVVYIAGYGRSGSTLLDVLLGSHEAIFGAGELVNLFSSAVRGWPCSCGLSPPACPFWGEVLKLVSSDLPGLGWDDADAITRRRDGISSFRRPRGPCTYERLWRSVFAAIGRMASVRVVVDSSKTAHDAYRRPGALREAGLDVRTIHLVRDPRAVVWTNVQRTRPILAGRVGRYTTELSVVNAVRTILGWMAAGRAARDGVLVRFEDLVTVPVPALRALEPVLGEDLGGVIDRLGRALPVAHGIAGNPMRRSGPVRLDPSLAELLVPGWARAVAAAGGPLARRYGYRSG